MPAAIWLILILILGAQAVGSLAASRSIQQIAVTDPTNSLQPQVATDSSNNLHVVWYDGADTDRAVKYAKGTFNGSGYTWTGPFDVYKPGGFSTFIHPRITVDGQNQVHVVWVWNNAILYRRWAANQLPSQGTTPQQIGSGVFPAVATDSANRVHIAWESSIGNYEVVYRMFDGAQWTAERNLSNNTGDSLSPDLVIDTSGAVNVIWYDKTTGSQRVYFTRGSGASWQTPQILSGLDSVFPSIAADAQNCVHMAWSEINSNTIVYRKSCNGQLQAGQIVGNNTSPRRAAVGATAGGAAAVTWDSSATGSTNVYYTLNTGSGWTAQKQIAGVSASQLWSDAHGMANGSIAVVWEETVGGQFDPAFAILNAAPPATPTPSPTPTPVISGSLSINGGAAITRQPTVSVTISNTSGTPATSYSVAEDAQPGTPATAFSNPSTTFNMTLNTADTRCRAHTIFGRIGNGSVVSPVFSSSIIYDPSATAFARAQNPNSDLNLPINGTGTTALPGGDVSYTRYERFTLLVMAPAEECTGLKRYAIVGHGAAAPASTDAAWKNVPADGYVSALIFFTANTGQGSYQFDVYVEDNAGNISAAPQVVQIVYDTDGPTISGATSNLPVTASSGGSIVTIDLGARDVSDNLYPGFGTNKQYWGYWVAVKQTSAGAPSEQEWEAYGQYAAGSIDAPITWDTSRGMVGSLQPGASYSIYVRVVDGAGNPSATLTTQSVQIDRVSFRGFMPLSQR